MCVCVCARVCVFVRVSVCARVKRYLDVFQGADIHNLGTIFLDGSVDRGLCELGLLSAHTSE